MRYVFSFVLLSFAAFALPKQAAAQEAPFLYDCAITRGGKTGTWVSPRLVIGTTEPGKYFAVDELILAVNGGPLPVRTRLRGDRLIAEWTFENLRDSLGQRTPDFSFQATLNTTRNTVRFFARPSLNSQTFSGSGTCRKLTDTDFNPNILLNN
ncbi:MAG: hypothetical protein AAGF56_14390 [Pseudomonadota bacterium]